jgi:phosphoglycolate phosphatase
MIRYKHIIWDWNGTLLDDVWLCVDIMDKMLAKRNLPGMTIEKYKEIFDFPVKDYYQKLGFDFFSESFETIGTEFIINYDRSHLHCKLFEDVIITLKEIQKLNIQQHILSARKITQLIEEVDFHQIKSYFSEIAGLNHHYADGKIELGKELIQKINDDKSGILLIGDTLHDFEVSKILGIDCFLIPNGHHSLSKLTVGTNKILNSLKEICNIL